jgi:hypothetical protein
MSNFNPPQAIYTEDVDDQSVVMLLQISPRRYIGYHKISAPTINVKFQKRFFLLIAEPLKLFIFSSTLKHYLKLEIFFFSVAAAGAGGAAVTDHKR